MLEFLDIPLTEGRTVEQMRAELQTTFVGWRYATNVEVLHLAFDFAIPLPSFAHGAQILTPPYPVGSNWGNIQPLASLVLNEPKWSIVGFTGDSGSNASMHGTGFMLANEGAFIGDRDSQVPGGHWLVRTAAGAPSVPQPTISVESSTVTLYQEIVVSGKWRPAGRCIVTTRRFIPVGFADTDATGNFRVTFTPGAFGRGTHTLAVTCASGTSPTGVMGIATSNDVQVTVVVPPPRLLYVITPVTYPSPVVVYVDFFDSSASCVIKDGTTILGPPDNPLYSLEFVLVQGTHSITATCTTHVYDGITLTSAPVLFEVKPQLASAETPTGTDVVVQPTDPSTGADSPIDLTFDNVQTPGTVSVSTALLSTSGGPHPPPNYNFVLSASSAGVYYEIKASSSLTFTGFVTVCITYDAIAFSSTDDLALLHYEPGGWVALPNQTVNTQTRTVCADTQSFSPFLLAERQKAPVVTGVTLPAGVQQIHTTVTLQAPFTDENQIDKHTGTFDLGYGALPGIVSESRGQGTLTRTHALDRAGVFQVTAAVSDGAITTTRSSALDVPPYLVVYDPTGGHVTGGGWITFGTGDCTLTAACTTSTGKANFGFVSKFLPGRTTPSGTIEFRAASFRFESASYEWLVVAGARAQFNGDGSVNGATGYGFLLTVIDGQVLGGGGVDRFRLKVWEKATGVVVYDNQRGADDKTDATTALGGGNIVIHKN